MLKPKFKIIYHRPDTNKPIGYLLLMSKGKQNRKRISTGIKLDQDKFIKYWNEKEQKFKSGLENYKLYNDTIQKVIKDNTKDEGQELVKPVKINSGSFLDFWQLQIDEIDNIGSKRKHEVVLAKLTEYQTNNKKKDLVYSDMTPDFINAVYRAFKLDKELSRNTAIDYMKLINNIIRRRIKKDPYTFPINPFAGIDYEERQKTERKVLVGGEIARLLTTKIDDPILDYARDMYVFQLFAAGMRISDLCLLRWSNIITDIVDFELDTIKGCITYKDKKIQPRIEYAMFKTEEEMDVPFTFYVCKSLLRVIDKIDVLNTFTYQITTDIEQQPQNKDPRQSLVWYELEIKRHTDKLTQSDNTILYKGYLIKDNDTKIKHLVDVVFREKQNLINKLIVKTAEEIKYYVVKNNCINDFVFPNLKSADFRNINQKELEFKDVIAKDKALYTKLQYGAKLYTDKLHKVGELCKITGIVSHSARHTFAGLLNKAGAPLQTIKNELGHQSVLVTDVYMRHKEFKDRKGENYFDKIGNNPDYLILGND